eukprot:189956-Rhodomonas_salina.1
MTILLEPLKPLAATLQLTAVSENQRLPSQSVCPSRVLDVDSAVPKDPPISVTLMLPVAALFARLKTERLVSKESSSVTDPTAKPE